MEYNCSICNKIYSSYKSRWLHIKKYHKNGNNLINNHVNHLDNPINNPINHPIMNQEIKCRKCNKPFTFIQNRWRHEQKCKDNKIEKIEEQNKKLEEEMKELKTIVNKLSKTSVNNLTVNGNINTVNNINSLGYENILSKLSEKDKIHLLTGFRHDEYPIIELVRKIYTNDDFKTERNTLLTNLQNKSCLIYKSDNNKFEATNKNQHINDIIKNRRDDIVSMYNQFTDTTKLKPKERKAIEDYLENIEGIDKKDKKLKAFYEKHKEEIIYIIYNCKEFMGTIRDHLINNDIEV
jgi:hypothetical protein